MYDYRYIYWYKKTNVIEEAITTTLKIHDKRLAGDRKTMNFGVREMKLNSSACKYIRMRSMYDTHVDIN